MVLEKLSFSRASYILTQFKNQRNQVSSIICEQRKTNNANGVFHNILKLNNMMLSVYLLTKSESLLFFFNFICPRSGIFDRSRIFTILHTISLVLSIYLFFKQREKRVGKNLSRFLFCLNLQNSEYILHVFDLFCMCIRGMENK